MAARQLFPAVVLFLSSCAALWAEERHECLIEPWKVVHVGARSTGVLSAMSIDRGQHVTKGEEIARLNSEVEAASLRVAERRATSTVQIDLAKARRDYEETSLKRNRELKARNVLSQEQLETSLASYEVARLQVVEAEDQKRQAELELARAQALFDLRVIVSPLNGIVMSIDRALGEFLSNNDNVATIAQIDPLKVEAFLPLEMIETVRVGDKVTIYPQAPVGGEYVGLVDVVDKVIDARSGTIGVRVRLENPDLRTLAGLRCDLAFTGR